eukprot:scaffold330345_cov51-Prasinocladus_malaysianus.AAC.1
MSPWAERSSFLFLLYSIERAINHLSVIPLSVVIFGIKSLTAVLSYSARQARLMHITIGLT